MEPRQVFHAYDRSLAGAEAANYCLACGSPLEDALHRDTVRRVCSARCGFVRFRNPAPAVAILVVQGERVLLCRRAKASFAGGRWCLPCGYVEYHEDFLTAAVREVEEETGLVVRIESILSVSSNFLAPDVHTVVTVLLASPVAGALRAGDDADGVDWFPAGGTLPDLAFEADRHIIERYFGTGLAGAPVQPR